MYLVVCTYPNFSISKMLSQRAIPIRPLQINSLFPVHRPHLVTVSSKYSIIPYSSIIFQLFLHTERLSKSHLETVCQQCYRVGTNFTFALFLQFEKVKHAFMQLFMVVPGK